MGAAAVGDGQVSNKLLPWTRGLNSSMIGGERYISNFKIVLHQSTVPQLRKENRQMFQTVHHLQAIYVIGVEKKVRYGKLSSLLVLMLTF